MRLGGGPQEGQGPCAAPPAASSSARQVHLLTLCCWEWVLQGGVLRLVESLPQRIAVAFSILRTFLLTKGGQGALAAAVRPTESLVSNGEGAVSGLKVSLPPPAAQNRLRCTLERPRPASKAHWAVMGVWRVLCTRGREHQCARVMPAGSADG